MIYKLRQNRISRTYKGGHNIDIFTGESFTKEGLYPEDWTASITTAANADGIVEGYGITDSYLKIKDIVGYDNLPILVKLLDSGERLAVQAHPTVDFARKNLNSPVGKTECWYFLKCDDDAYVYLGFKKGITKQKWGNAIDECNCDKILSMLHKHSVKQGDFVFVDGGIPHAIGKGCFMIELQEPSDLMVVAEKHTVSGRKIPNYRLDMGLGFDKALDLYDYHGYTYDEIKLKYFSHPIPQVNSCVPILTDKQTEKFSMSLLCGNSQYMLSRKYAIAIVISGSGNFCDKSVKSGERFFIASETIITACGDSDFKVIICS